MPAPDLLSLTEITFVAGSRPGAPGAHALTGNVTLLIGPNNSGKSLALRELASWPGGTPEPMLGYPASIPAWPGGSVVAAADAKWPATSEELDQLLERRAAPPQGDPNSGNVLIRSFSLEGTMMPGSGGSVSLPRFSDGDLAYHCRTQVMPHYVALLNGQSRFGLSETRQLTNLREPPSNHLMAILRDPALYERVDTMVRNAFSLHLVIDMTQPPSLSVSLSETAPPDDWHERLLAEDVIAYQKQAKPISEFSDGVRSYVGLVSAVQSLPHQVLLIDEPEAFLHPTLVRRLGGDLAAVARDRSASLVAATHSADFLMGCVGEVPETTIVRLTYERGVATTRVLDGPSVARLVSEPLLRAAGALSALFARGAVICEADSDRAFYDEINRRLLQTPGRNGAPDTVFLNAQNWQTTRTIASPLRALGIPAAIVLDLDVVLKDDAWGAFLDLAGVEGQTKTALLEERRQCAALLEGMGTVDGRPNSLKRCKRDGLAGLPPADRTRVEGFLDTLATYGIFVVPVGELEKWLAQFGLTNKQTWVTDMLQHLGAAGSAAYITPGTGDVWTFVEKIGAWIRDPARLGLPDQ